MISMHSLLYAFVIIHKINNSNNIIIIYTLVASLPFLVALYFMMAYLCGMKYYVSVNLLCTLDLQLNEFAYIRLLTLGTHAPQGYSSCVCVSSSLFSNSNESARNTYRSPQFCNRLIKNVGFFVNSLFVKIQNSSGSRIGTPFGHFTCSRRLPSIYPVTLHCSQQCAVFVPDFAIVFGATLHSARAYLHHWRLTSTTCNHSPERRYNPM